MGLWLEKRSDRRVWRVLLSLGDNEWCWLQTLCPPSPSVNTSQQSVGEKGAGQQHKHEAKNWARTWIMHEVKVLSSLTTKQFFFFFECPMISVLMLQKSCFLFGLVNIQYWACRFLDKHMFSFRLSGHLNCMYMYMYIYYDMFIMLYDQKEM